MSISSSLPDGEWNLVLLSYGIAYAIQNVLSLSTLSSFIALGQVCF